MSDDTPEQMSSMEAALADHRILGELLSVVAEVIPDAPLAYYARAGRFLTVTISRGYRDPTDHRPALAAIAAALGIQDGWAPTRNGTRVSFSYEGKWRGISVQIRADEPYVSPDVVQPLPEPLPAPQDAEGGEPCG